MQAENLHEDQVSQNTSIVGEGAHNVPPLAVKLFATDYCWKTEGVFFQDVFHERPSIHDPICVPILIHI